jgi:hypothetical protein
MSTDSDPVSFDRAAARRIAKRIRQVERHPDRIIGDVGRTTLPQQETVFARLTAHVAPDEDNPGAGPKWEWQQVQRVSDGTWAIVANGRQGSNSADPKLLAFEIRKAGAAVGSIVLLRRCPVKPTDPTQPYTLDWAIVSYISPFNWGKVSVIWSPGSNLITVTPTDDSGTPTGDPDANVLIEFPLGSGVAQFCAYAIDDLVAYFDSLGDGSQFVLFRNKLPTLTSQYMGWYNNASSGQNVVADFVRAI